MYCPECDCEYVGWSEKCPVCRTILLEAKTINIKVESEPLAYAALLDIVRENGGTLTIDMIATGIEMKRGRDLIYIGRGYAWAKHMEGECDGCYAELTTTEVGRERKRGFPYFGYGFAWEKEMQGSVSGNALTLKAEKVAREQKMEFPYKGYGRAWVQTMSGKCGGKLEAHLTITEVQQRKQWRFPYFGFGFAWPSAGKLTLTLVD